MQFIAHNIEFKNGTRTRGESHLLADTLFMQAIRQAIEQYVPTPPTGQRFTAADLACHEGGFSVELARMGFDTLGIDARKENLFKANYVKFNTGLDHLRFALDDVRNLERYGPFDVVFCTGIVYHLDQPADFLKMLYRQTKQVLVLYSFYAPTFDPLYDLRTAYYRLRRTLGMKKPDLIEAYTRLGITLEDRRNTPAYISHYKSARLGLLTRHEGYAGRWYREWDQNSDKAKVESKVEAAYSNHRSFWFTREELTRALYDAGFTQVHEQKAPLGDFHSRFPSSFFGRTLLVAVK